MYFHTVDIAHPPLTSDSAEALLDDEVTQVRYTQKWRVLKVIHGIGSAERQSLLKQVVHNWAWRNRSHLKAVIPGEEYHLYNPVIQEMRNTCGQVPDPDLGALNPGLTLIWIK
jgi:hypothetical protein